MRRKFQLIHYFKSIYFLPPTSPDTKGEQQQLREASANQSSYNALVIVLVVMVAAVLVVMAVLVTDRVWNIIKRKKELKDR